MSNTKIPVLTNAISGPGKKTKEQVEKEFKKMTLETFNNTLKDNLKDICLNYPQYTKEILDFETKMQNYAHKVLNKSKSL